MCRPLRKGFRRQGFRPDDPGFEYPHVGGHSGKLGATAEQPRPEDIVSALTAVATARLGRAPKTSAARLLTALDPRNFVQVRTVPGGPAPSAVTRFLEDAERALTAQTAWRNDARARLARADSERARRTGELSRA